MNKQTLLAVALTAASAMQMASAEEFLDNRWYASPFGTFISPGGNDLHRGQHEGWGAGLGIGKIINEHFNVEVRGIYDSFVSKDGDWDSAGATADVQYYLSRGKFAPYGVLALGGLNTSVGNKDAASFIIEPGVGLTYEVNDNFLLRSDVRYRYNDSETLFPGTKANDEFHDVVVNVGFVIPFGAKPTAAKVEMPMPAPTPAPIAKAVDCSTLDEDADGVNNCADKCPGTMSGSKVDFDGCPVSLELKGVNFKVNSAQLTPGAMAILDRVATSLMGYPEKNEIEVHGHTSSEGSTAHNMKLSQKRSQSVADYLKMRGVTNRLVAKGYGESTPVADNSTEEGRSMNRRVELVWGN
ncbi:OmpA family protein [Methylosoma difficile]